MKVRTSKVDCDQEDLNQLSKMIDGLKDGTIVMGPENISQEDILKCVEGMLDPDKEDFKFIYTQIIPIDRGFILQWGAKAYGFGEFTMQIKRGEVHTDLKDDSDKEVFMMAMARIIGWNQ